MEINHMLTIGYQNWAVDLKDVGAIYPFQGYEMAMVIAAVVFWLVWHIWQLAHEDAEFRAASREIDRAKADRQIDRY
jgi:hypothetical protein